MLVLDEPTFGQDANTWRELARLIVGLRDEEVGIVAVTHDETFVDAVADRRLVIERPASVDPHLNADSAGTEVHR
jgi:energy-coupling factor transport system ATP-binding protein